MSEHVYEDDMGGDDDSSERQDLGDMSPDEYLEATVVQSNGGGPPLLNLDLDIDDERRGRIVICDGDDLGALAAEFVATHGLEGGMQEAVAALLEGNLQQHVAEMMQEEHSAGSAPMPSLQEMPEDEQDTSAMEEADEGGLL